MQTRTHTCLLYTSCRLVYCLKYAQFHSQMLRRNLPEDGKMDLPKICGKTAELNPEKGLTI